VNYQDGRYLVYAGFQRAHAANTVLKWKEIPCSVENDLPTEVMRRRAILDNTHAGKWDADTLANWEFEPEELEDMWVNPAVWGGDGEEVEAPDYSDKNKEIDVDGLESLMTISLKYEADEYWKVKEQLSKIAGTPEQAVWKLLGNE
jgi:hypothetical protein